MGLFETKEFRMHSGSLGSFKIECDALTDEDIATLAKLVGDRIKFTQVIGVPSGGLRLAKALEPYAISKGHILIVDDVLTTGGSMEEARSYLSNPDVVGVVIFSRGKCPDWIKPIFQLQDW